MAQKETAQHATETVEQRSERLRKLSETDHAKCASERQVTLQRKSLKEWQTNPPRRGK